MPKVMVSFDGRNTNGTFDIDIVNTVGEPHMEISRNTVIYKLNFISKRERELFNEGIGLCRAITKEGRYLYLTAYGKPKPADTTP